MKLLSLKILFPLCLCIISVVFFECKKEEETIIVHETGYVVDREGNSYNTIKIGELWWMVENLKVTVYNDSTPIIEIKSTENDTIWANQNNGAYCQLDARFGLLYNWYAINDTKKIAPEGWHIPTDNEWKQLEINLGMTQSEVDKTAWRGNNESEKLIPEASIGWPYGSSVFGSNESGFSALPGGCRLFNGTKGEVTQTAFWWAASSQNDQKAWYRNLSSNSNKIFRYFADKNYGFSIRCVKNY